MAYIHPDALEYERRRWLRHDAYRFIRPDWRRYVQPGTTLAATYEDIERKYRPDQPRVPCFAGGQQRAREATHKPPRDVNERARTNDDLDIQALMAVRTIESNLLRLKWLAAATRFEIAMHRHDRALRRALKYNPGQPRVPRGNPDGGQWTSAGGSAGGQSLTRTPDEPTAGSGRSDPRILSDATPDNFYKPGTQLAQNERQRQEPIRLEGEELKGGHTIEFHVNRSEIALKAQAQARFDSNPKAEDVRSGSFSSLAAANKLVNSTLAQNQAIVDSVASGVIKEKVIISEFNSITGIEAVAPNARSQPYIQKTYKVGVFIIHDPYASRGYRIYTSFPTNRSR